MAELISPARVDKATILAIGTELTTGQITNRNASWLSEKLVDLGVETVLHETVPDDRALILSALDRCRKLSDLIFVTGGLGPTTDDFTRDVIADWTNQPLKFYEPSWTKINERLKLFGIPVASSNRQQAYYPESAEVIVNAQGTADAFAMKLTPDVSVNPVESAFSSEGLIIVLPGPPREVEAVWYAGIESRIRTRNPHVKPLKLLTWQCIGKSEAELGEITERTLEGSGLKTGYRAHRPYVEIKVWCTDEELKKHKGLLEELDCVLSPWVATRQGKDLAAKLFSLLTRADEIEISDAGSGGILSERLGNCLRDAEFQAQADSVILSTEWLVPDSPEAWVRECLTEADPQALQLAIAGPGEKGAWALGLREGSRILIETAISPYRGPELLDRSRRFTVEFALKRWCEWLSAATQ